MPDGDHSFTPRKMSGRTEEQNWKTAVEEIVTYLSVCACATGHRLNPLAYLRDVLDQLAARSADADANDLLPDAWAIRHAQIN